MTGKPGFIHSPSNDRLQIRVSAKHHCMDLERLTAGAALGILGIDLGTRRRNRVNGVVVAVLNKGDEILIDIAVKESFGNCPKYIQRREVYPAEQSKNCVQRTVSVEKVLSQRARQLIAKADTFFIASQYSGGARANADSASVDSGSVDSGSVDIVNNYSASADISHRGGELGFVSVQDSSELIFPDYTGNRHFNTLGNLSLNSGVGLLFIDFTGGDVLQLRGESKILWDDPRLPRFPGAERLVQFVVRESIWTQGAIPLRWNKVEKGKQ